MQSVKVLRPRKRRLRNLVRRSGSRNWYWKRVLGGKQVFESLRTDDLTLAMARRDVKEKLFVSGELEKLREAKHSATLAEVFALRDQIGGITAKSIYESKRALLNLMRVGLRRSEATAADLSLGDLCPKLTRDYQDAMRHEYEATAGPDEKDRRAARDRADRSSKSLVNQAKSIFSRKHQLVERYRELGLIIPDTVEKWHAARAVGSNTSKEYLPPDDRALAKTFSAIEEEKAGDRELYDLFWCVVAFGGRRNEALDIRTADLVEINGELWLNGGWGKDGRVIQLPLINWPVHPESGTIPSAVVRELRDRVQGSGHRPDATEFLFGENRHYRQDVLPRRANAWLADRGWNDTKKLHALRAYVGSVLYLKNPRQAQRYLRHKHMSTTEEFYTHFLESARVTTWKPEQLVNQEIRTGTTGY